MKDYEALSRAHFDRQAAEYDARDTWYWSRQGKISCRDIDAFLANRPFETILDVGCATGYLAELLAARRPVAYTGLDIAAEMNIVSLAKNLAKERGFTMILSMHDLNLALSLGDYFAFLKGGKLLSFGGRDTIDSKTISATFGIAAERVDVDGREYIIYGGKQ